MSHTVITGHFNNTRDGHHVSRHTAVHQILREFTLNGARDSTGLTLVIWDQLLNPEHKTDE